MPDSTLYTLAVLIDNRSVYASGHAGGNFKEQAPGLDPKGELRLRTLLSSALERILLLEPLTDAELDACRQALKWYREFEEADGISLDAPLAMLDAWNRPGDVPDHEAASDLGLAIYAGALAEEGGPRAAPRADRNQVLAQQLRERGSRRTRDVAEEIHVACGLAEVNARKAPWRLQRGEVEEAVAGLDEAIDALRGVRERIMG